MTKKQGKKSTKKIEEDQDQDVLPESLPVLISVDLVAFPHVMMSLYIDQPHSIKAVEAAIEESGLIFIIAEEGDEVGRIGINDLCRFGIVAEVIKMLRLTDGRYKILLQGKYRGKARKYHELNNYLVASISPVAEKPVKINETIENLLQNIRENLQVLVEYEHVPEELLLVTEELDDPGVLADIIIAHYKLEVPEAQALLEELDPAVRIAETDKIIKSDLNKLVVTEGVKDKTREELTRGQRDFFLREQLKQIQRELGEDDSVSEDLLSLKKSLDAKKMPENARTEADKQFQRLERMHPETSEYAMLRTYLEWVVDLPWSDSTRDRISLKIAENILNEDHFGLEKPKDRILEFLSVRKLKKDSKGPILCFVGPPGVGKTSLGRSIARCLNRQFFRMSLGGVRDEAEMRGHRRTYVGALPGRIIQGLKEAGTNNPVFLLDELDKVGSDFRGDPASALLEILDPVQNKTFRDHYLNMEFDLSRCLFIATANTTDTIPDALLDRLEVIYISGYTLDEKNRIASKYLIPRQLKEHGLVKQSIEFADEAIRFLIERYTREAGVRNLEREIGSVCRKLARQIVDKEEAIKVITEEVIQNFLGPTRFDPEQDDKEDQIGLARGLAWTVAGGDVLPVEVSVAPGKGKLTLTGQLGDVMQESAQAAVFYARANAEDLGFDSSFYHKTDIHIHLPGGATPKDGPSAGITIVTALVSMLSGRKVSKDVAMTGEITLRGSVLQVGGLKEKALAALRYGISKIVIPAGNEKDIQDIPAEQRQQLTFFPVRHVSEVLEIALLPEESRPDPSTLGTRGKAMKGTLLVEKKL